MPNDDSQIKNFDDLYEQLSTKGLNVHDRAYILAVVSEKLGTIIKNIDQLLKLLNNIELVAHQHTLIFNAFLKHYLLIRHDDLYKLLTCDKLNENDHKLILDHYKDHLEEMVSTLDIENKLDGIFLKLNTENAKKIVGASSKGNPRSADELKTLSIQERTAAEHAIEDICNPKYSYSGKELLGRLKAAFSKLKSHYLIRSITEKPRSDYSFFSGYSASVKLQAVNEILKEIESLKSGEAQPAASAPNSEISKAKHEGLLGKLYTKLQSLPEFQPPPPSSSRRPGRS